jgi:ribosomal protein L28
MCEQPTATFTKRKLDRFFQPNMWKLRLEVLIAKRRYIPNLKPATRAETKNQLIK